MMEEVQTSLKNISVNKKIVKEKDQKVEIGLEELEELEKVMGKTKNERVLKILENDLGRFRSKFVTKTINDSFSVDIPPFGPVKIPFDEKKYLLSNIRGYKKKVRAVKDCHPNLPEEKIIDALIRFNGDEEETISGLFSDSDLPPLPIVPKKVIKKHNKSQKREIKVYKERKKAASRKKNVILLTDLTKKSSEVDLRRRMEIIDFEKRNVENIMSHMKPLELQMIIEKEEEKKRKNKKEKEEEESGQPERLFLLGELNAIHNNKPRMFTFRPERTFSNEVSHVHFRVAESQFYRMSGKSLKVVEVKYIVTPKLIKKFEEYKKNIIIESKKGGKGKKKRRIKQYLLHTSSPPHNVSENTSNTPFHNYPSKSFRRGRLFSSRREICDRQFFSNVHMRGREREQTLILSLVVTGQEIVKKISSSVICEKKMTSKEAKKLRRKEKKMMKLEKKRKKSTKGAFGDLKKKSVKYVNYFKELNLEYQEVKVKKKNMIAKKKQQQQEEEEEEEGEEGEGEKGKDEEEVEYDLDFDAVVDPSKDCVIVFNQDQVLPYYLVKYSRIRDRFTHLGNEWSSMKDSASADKQQEEIKKTYLGLLEKKEKDLKDKKFYETYEMNLEKDEIMSEEKEKQQIDEVDKVMILDDEDENNIVFESDGDNDLESFDQFQSPGSPENEEEGELSDEAVFDSSGSPSGDDSPVFDDENIE